MLVKVKICGVRTLEAAQVATQTGADYLGFNFVSSSKRYISPNDALKIIKLIKGKIKLVGVFQNSNINNVNNIVTNLGLDFVQLHGKENNDYIKKVQVPVIKSVTIKDEFSKIKTEYFILDRINRGQGKMVDIKRAARLSIEFPIFYAGGLNPENVENVINKVHPFAVDVAGGIETNGYQDLDKIKAFIKNAKGISL